MMNKKKISEELNACLNQAYAEQPFCFEAFKRLCQLFLVLYCDHEWRNQLAGGPPDSEDSLETVRYCAKCGADYDLWIGDGD